MPWIVHKETIPLTSVPGITLIMVPETVLYKTPFALTGDISNPDKVPF